MSLEARPRVVAVGGGHGLSRTVAALARMGVEATAVVTVADDGGSSGRLRRDLGVVPPGDLRKAVAATTPDPRLAALLEYRFRGGELADHALGNLLLVALEEIHGGLTPGLDALRRLVGSRIRVLPCTPAVVHLVAEGAQGTVEGQVAIATSSGHQTVRLEPADPPADPDAVTAIAAADLVVLGPGSLFTSILPNVMVPGIGEALRRTSARLVYVANLREQPGETEGMDQRAHVDVLTDHLGARVLDVVVFHAGSHPAGPGARLEPLTTHPNVERVVTADLLDGDDGHDPEALAKLLRRLLAS